MTTSRGMAGVASTVGRPRLLDELRHSDASVICLVAGAGYGKTVLARQWSVADDRSFAWLELHRADDDPVVLMRQLIDVLGALGSLVDLDDVASAAREPAPRFAGRVLPLMGRALAAVNEPFVLVIDEVEVLGAESSELLDDVLSLLPEAAQAALLGRRLHPALRTARREAGGSALRIGPAELAFDLDETAALVALRAGRHDRCAAADLLERTSGWPLALGLAMIAQRNRAPAAGSGRMLDEEGQLLRRYLDEEVLGPLDEDDRGFLTASSVLEWLSGELCDRVLQRGDSAQRLAHLLGDGHVLFVEGGGRHGVRYHPVLRSVLLDQLRRADPRGEQELRRRAVAAYEDLGQHRTAIDAAVEGNDVGLAAEVLFRHLPTVIYNGEYVSLARWLGAFSEEQRHRSGLLALAEAWLAFLTNRRRDLESWLAAAEGLAPDGPLPDGSTSSEIAVAALRMLAGLDGALVAARDAGLVRRAGALASPWWAAAAGTESITRIHAGLDTDAVESLRSAEFDSRGLPASHATNCAFLGFEHLRRGESDTGLALVRGAVDEVVDAELQDFPLTALVFCVQAYAEAHRGDVGRARTAADHARLLIAGVADVIDRQFVHAHLLLSEVALATGDPDRAALDWRAARDRLSTQPDVVVLHDWSRSLEHRLGRGRGPRTISISSAERRVLRELPTHRSLAEIGTELYLSRNTVKTHTVAIYRKLGVSSRSDAVRIAKELDLL